MRIYRYCIVTVLMDGDESKLRATVTALLHRSGFPVAGDLQHFLSLAPDWAAADGVAGVEQ